MHAEYGIENLMGTLTTRTWRWFAVRLAGLPSESAWGFALYPVDPTTGKRTRRASVAVIDDPAEVDAFFARQAG